MINLHTRLYESLLDQAHSDDRVSRLLLGINWSVSLVESGSGANTAVRCGICFSPANIPRTNPWAGTLRGRTTRELGQWILQWDAASAVVGSLCINASINSRSALLAQADPVTKSDRPHLGVFDHFRPQLANKTVVVIGHYPALEPFPEAAQWHCLERNLQPGDLPDTAADFLLPKADWVFITASSISNKTLPRLLQLAGSAQVVLMGPSLPWMSGWKEFGVDHLAGVEIINTDSAWQVAEEGGGTRLFDDSIRYRVLSL